jgi:hypothetical protein
MELKIIIIFLQFVLTFAFGIWLRKLGKPYNVVVFTFHKILALLTLIFTGLAIIKLNQDIDVRTVELLIILATGFLFLTSFVSGALLSIGKPAHDSMKIAHKISSILTPILAGIVIYLLLRL